MLCITTPNSRGEVDLVKKTAEALGYEVYSFSWRIPDHFAKEDGIVYGEQLFCETIAQQMNWRLQKNPLDWLANIPEEYVRKDDLSQYLKVLWQMYIYCY